MRTAAYSLSFEDAVQVWLRRWLGEYQHDIAASYRVNPARVNDVLKGRLHPSSESVALATEARVA